MPTLLLLLLVAVVLAVAWAPAAEDTAFPAAVQLLWQLVWAPAADDVPPCAAPTTKLQACNATLVLCEATWGTSTTAAMAMQFLALSRGWADPATTTPDKARPSAKNRLPGAGRAGWLAGVLVLVVQG